jgi:hypothetical protein
LFEDIRFPVRKNSWGPIYNIQDFSKM